MWLVTASLPASPLCRCWCQMSRDLGLRVDVSDVQDEDIIMAVVTGTHDEERCSDSEHHPLCFPASHWLSAACLVCDQLALLCVRRLTIGWRNSCSALIGSQLTVVNTSAGQQAAWARARASTPECDVLWWWARQPGKSVPPVWTRALTTDYVMTRSLYPVSKYHCI